MKGKNGLSFVLGREVLSEYLETTVKNYISICGGMYSSFNFADWFSCKLSDFSFVEYAFMELLSFEDSMFDVRCQHVQYANSFDEFLEVYVFYKLGNCELIHFKQLIIM